MKPGIRDYLFLAAIAITALLLFLLWTDSQLRPELESRMQEELVRTARLVQAVSGNQPFTDSLADALAEIAGDRVSLIDHDGVVLGDSRVTEQRLPSIVNHGDRPEVKAALAGQPGSSIRASETVSLRLMYVAVPDPRGAVRVASSIAPLQAVIDRTRQFALTATLGLLALAAGLFMFRRQQVGRAYTRTAAALRGISEGTYDPPFEVLSAPDPDVLEAEVDRVAVAVGDRIGELLNERDDLETVLTHLDDGLALVDDSGTIIRANPSFARWMGRDAVLGERTSALFRDPQNLETVRLGLEGHAADREATIGEKTVHMVVRPHRDGAVIVLRDLTRRRRMESVRRDFLANVSHELKTPLTSIRGFAEAMAQDSLEPDQVTEFSSRIVANSERMQLLIDDLLELTRIESGSWSPTPADTDVTVLGRSVWAAMQPIADERRITLEVESDGDHQVNADPDSLRQILQNLFDNAVRYSPEGAAIRLEIRGENDRHLIRVSDAGPGIPRAHLERVFERFYRVDAARSRERGGTGLGLSIVKHLVAAHGGEVGVISELGSGTTVWFTLPTI